MVTQKRAIAVFDPYVSPSYFKARLPKSIAFIGILTPLNLTQAQQVQRMNPALFDKLIKLTGNIDDDEKTLKFALQDYDVLIYLPGNEISLPYVSPLIARLMPKQANDPRTLNYRQNKSAMQLALKNKGLNYIPFFQMDRTTEKTVIDETIDTIGLPLVIKPAEGVAGSIGVRVCQSRSAVHAAIKMAFELDGFFGAMINKLVLQKFIKGTEYIIDAASFNGQHKITSLFKYKKDFDGPVPLFRRCEMPTLDPKTEQALFAFSIQVLDALEMRTGLAHMEFMITDEKEFYLIELNPRIVGGFGYISQMSWFVNGRDQVSDLLALMNIQVKDEPDKNQYRWACMIALQTFAYVFNQVDVTKLTELSTYQDHVLLRESVDKPSMPVCLEDTVAFILLASNDKEQLEADKQIIQLYEKTGEIFR